MDWRIFAGGVSMIAVGSTLGIIYGSVLASGPLEEFNPSRGIIQMGTLIAGIGILLTLVSFGLGRKKRRLGGDKGKGTTTFKPSQPPT